MAAAERSMCKEMRKKKKQVSCYEIRQKIKPYITGEMELSEACEFVEHVRHCKECREELEAYYAFSAALMQIDYKDDVKGNFFLNIEKRLERTEAAAAKAKKEHLMKWIVYVGVALFIAAATGVSFGT